MWSVISGAMYAGENESQLFRWWKCDGDAEVRTLPGFLCRDPWSDSPSWLLVAPATLYQDDGGRGSLTRVQGRCNDMHALRAFCPHPPLLYACPFPAHSPLKPPLCSPAMSHSRSLSTFPIKCVCASQSVFHCLLKNRLTVRNWDLCCLQVVLHTGVCG